MFNYILRRLILLPITLFFIVLVNFVIINLAPGDPVSLREVSKQGEATQREDRSTAFGSDERYLQFREHYGLTLPILFNSWPWTRERQVKEMLWTLVNRKKTIESKEEINFKDYEALRVRLGDMARFIMPLLLEIVLDTHESLEMRRMAGRFFLRGGYRQAFLGPDRSEEEKAYNRKIAKDNTLLNSLMMPTHATVEEINEKALQMKTWYQANRDYYLFEPTFWEKVRIFFFETRFTRYMSRVLMFDFGTMRNDSNKTVLSEVVKRFKYSLTLSIIPMLLTFVFCQIFGFIMAYRQNQWPDYTLNLTALVLYAIPVFVVAPFLIEKVALNGYFPFTEIPIPLNGFTSPDSIYENQVSYQRLFDVLAHIALPLLAIIYGTLAAQSRLARTAVLEVLRQDYVRTARAKGLGPLTIMFKHVGRNAGITIVTSIASSLGVVLGGSLIVETLFEINGFGKFFYDAIINRDYNVIMFSALAGSFLTLLGYLVADIAYTTLDPRLTLE
jgi:peptide/nickel transport system permease protein